MQVRLDRQTLCAASGSCGAWQRVRMPVHELLCAHAYCLVDFFMSFMCVSVVCLGEG